MKKTFNLFALLCTLGLMLVVLAGCKEKTLPETTTQAPAPVTTTEAPAPRTTTEEPAPVTTTEEPAPVTTTEHVHSWGEGTVTTNPTCTTAGVRTFTCSCGQTKTEAEPALGHNMTHHEAVAATCTEAGSIEYWSCSRCNKNFSDEAGQTEVSSIVVAALDHDYEQKVSYAKIADGKVETLNVCKRDASHTELVSTKYINEYDTIAHATGFNNNNSTVMDGSTYAIDPSTKTVTIKTLPSSMGAWFRFDFARNANITYKYGFIVLKGDNDALNVGVKFDTLGQDGIANNKYDGTNGNKQYKKVGNDTIIIVWDFEALQMNSKELAKVVIWAYGNGGATNIKLEIVASGMFNLNEGTERVFEHNLVDDAAVPATCVEPGKAAGHHCTGCDYKDGGEATPLADHTFVDNVCSVCGERRISLNPLNNTNAYNANGIYHAPQVKTRELVEGGLKAVFNDSSWSYFTIMLNNNGENLSMESLDDLDAIVVTFTCSSAFGGILLADQADTLTQLKAGKNVLVLSQELLKAKGKIDASGFWLQFSATVEDEYIIIESIVGLYPKAEEAPDTGIVLNSFTDGNMYTTNGIYWTNAGSIEKVEGGVQLTCTAAWSYLYIDIRKDGVLLTLDEVKALDKLVLVLDSTQTMARFGIAEVLAHNLVVGENRIVFSHADLQSAVVDANGFKLQVGGLEEGTVLTFKSLTGYESE